MKANNMAKFKVKCGGKELKVNDWDHEPAHCHVLGDGQNVRVSLHSLEVLHPPSAVLSRPVRKCLEQHQAAMLIAWDQVHILVGQEPG